MGTKREWLGFILTLMFKNNHLAFNRKVNGGGEEIRKRIQETNKLYKPFVSRHFVCITVTTIVSVCISWVLMGTRSMGT